MNRCLVLLLLMLPIRFVQADEIHMATFPIPLMVENENTGVFVDLLKEIELLIPHTIKLSVFPAKRTNLLFAQQDIDGFFPALDVIMPTIAHRSSSIYVKQDFAFVKKGETPPIDVNELIDKNVGLTMGYPYVEQVLSTPKRISYAVNDYANVLKLDAGRIDVFVVEEKSGLQAVKASHLNSIVYNSNSPLSEQDVYFAFIATERGRKYAEEFSRALTVLKGNGKFQAIMARAGK